MKKFNLLLFIMMFLALTSVWAEAGIAPIADTSGYHEKASSSFTIKAYKKTPDPVIMSIYDAFSRNLDEVVTGSEINVYPKMSYFLTDDFNNMQDPHKRVIFSFLVTGASTGTFSLDITITPFKGPCTLKDGQWSDGTGIVDSHFDFVDYDINFQRGGKESSSKFYEIKKNTPAKSNVNMADSNASATLHAAWSVVYKGSSSGNGNTSAVGEYWNAEGSVAMAIRKSGNHGYDSANTAAGRYQALVTINMTVN